MTPAMQAVEQIIKEHALDRYEASNIKMRAWNDPQEARRLAESLKPHPSEIKPAK